MEKGSPGKRNKNIHVADKNNRVVITGRITIKSSLTTIFGNLAHFPMSYPFFQSLYNKGYIYIHTHTYVTE